MKTCKNLRGSRNTTIAGGIILATMLGQGMIATAGERDQAKRMHDRIAGVPPSAAVLDSMTNKLSNGDAIAAALEATESESFYNVTLKNFAAPWTNEAMSRFVPLNDYTATVIGLVRDEADFRQVLYEDVLYVGDGTLGLPDYSTSDNDHYRELEDKGYSLKKGLVRRTQSSQTGLPSSATAGVITSRASSQAFFSAGTNRAMLRFTMLNHLCKDLEQVSDVSLPPDRVRQDISRSPGGDSRVFLNNCVGCHNGMDPLAQAFAYYDFEYDADNDPDGLMGRLVYNTVNDVDPETGTRVDAKYHINSANFPGGYVTLDDQWENYWRSGSNRRLGWDKSLPGSGSGAKSMGREFAHSQAFAECQVQKVFSNVCLRKPENSADRSQIASMTASFQGSGHNLKRVFAESAAYCKGE